MFFLISRRSVGYLGIVALGAFCFTSILLWPQPRVSRTKEDGSKGRPSAQGTTFDGTSAELKETIVVPTLDTPLPDGKSVVWCSSFVLAWNRLKHDITRGPVRLRNAEVVAERLNQAKESQDDLAPRTAYSAAGRVQDGALDRIRMSMARQFPHVSLPSCFQEDGHVLVAYAYLQANVRYKHAFIDNDEAFVFTDATGKRSAVRSFGIRPEDTNKDANLVSFRGQVRILWEDRQQDQFAIDLCVDSQPNQIVLAKVPRKATLAETYADLEAKTASLNSAKGSELHAEDSLLVPNQCWNLEHRFQELEGRDKLLLNPGFERLWLDIAFQNVRFKIDREGAELASQSVIFFNNGGPRRYHFDKPFLVIMKKRDGKRPFFLMWVDNAELLTRM
jgi:hypothetical protein